MKRIQRSLLLAAITICCSTSLFSQIIVTVRPSRPVVKRIVAPSPRHIWVEEDWRPQGNTYVFSGGYWAAPPRVHAAWVPGHWRKRPRGWVWVPGHWR